MKITNKTIQISLNPGCYMFKNKNNQIIYVGKAKNLKKRVLSYFRANTNLTASKKQMIQEIVDIETIIVMNETEALLLEVNLIKKYKPKYNVIMKDDKNFSYLKITNEPFPKLEISKNIQNDGAKYFGPYLSAGSLKNIYKFINKIFPSRNCKKDLSSLPKGKICIEYNMERCLGPCEKLCTINEYKQVIDQINKFLNGDTKNILVDLKTKMNAYAKNKQFEKAAIYRDRVKDIERMNAKQVVVSTQNKNQDIINLYQFQKYNIINVLRIRTGKLLNNINIQIKTKNLNKKEILTDFIKQYYKSNLELPKEIITPFVLNISENKLELLIKNKIKLSSKTKGDYKKLLNLSLLNAQNHFQKIIPKFTVMEKENIITLNKLQKALNVKNYLHRIECYDISNIQGQHAVGSMIVFTDGQIDKKEYKKFKIKYTKKINDFAMLSEIIGRRFNNHPEWQKPELIIIDGGKGQLNAVLKTLKKIAKEINVISLAKKKEEIFLPNKKTALKLKTGSNEFYLIQKIRDEAHRFAINYYKKLHKREQTKTILNDIPGIGSIYQKKLLKQFKTINNIKKADIEKISKITGKKLAKNIKNKFQSQD